MRPRHGRSVCGRPAVLRVLSDCATPMDLNGWHTVSAGSFGSTVLEQGSMLLAPRRRDSHTYCRRRARMKAVVCEAFGGPEVLAWRDVPDPAPPGPGEIQVRIEARGVQYVDV